MVFILLEEFLLFLEFVMHLLLWALDLSSRKLGEFQSSSLEQSSISLSSLLWWVGLLKGKKFMVSLSVIFQNINWHLLSVVYILAALWGIADAIWQTQINALYGVLFPSEEEAAFSNYRLWESLGFLVAFITLSCGVCAFPKLILAIFLLAAGMVGYLILEYQLRKEWRNLQ